MRMSRACASRAVAPQRRVSRRRPHRAWAEREVIVRGGAINLPKLLLLLGIGPVDDLRRLGVPVTHDLPGVGKNLHDHLNV